MLSTVSRAEYMRLWRARQTSERRPPGRPISAACGTVGGYHRHQRVHEPACDRCKAALAQDRRTRRAWQTLNRSDARSRALMEAALTHLRSDPDRTLRIARRNLTRTLAASPASRVHVEQWTELLSAPVDFRQVEEQALAWTDKGQVLRSTSPFAGILTDSERVDAINRGMRRATSTT
jgi:hypothetical protein